MDETKGFEVVTLGQRDALVEVLPGLYPTRKDADRARDMAAWNNGETYGRHYHVRPAGAAYFQIGLNEGEGWGVTPCSTCGQTKVDVQISGIRWAPRAAVECSVCIHEADVREARHVYGGLCYCGTTHSPD